jgi:DNA-directed RNA polymerase specialized sigma24 family protein
MAALKGTDNFFKYKAQIITLQDMRDDYRIISAVVDSMGDEYDQYIKYLYKKNSIARAADAEGVSTEAIKSRFYRAKKEIRETSKAWMINSNKYSLLKKGA